MDWQRHAPNQQRRKGKKPASLNLFMVTFFCKRESKFAEQSPNRTKQIRLGGEKAIRSLLVLF